MRLDQQPIPLIGFRKHVMETREPLMIEEITPEVLERYGNPVVLSGEPPKSALFVPLVVGRTGHRRDLAPERRPDARLRRGRPAAPDDARQQPQRRARQRSPRRTRRASAWPSSRRSTASARRSRRSSTSTR